jgi:hypothetical protein
LNIQKQTIGVLTIAMAGLLLFFWQIAPGHALGHTLSPPEPASSPPALAPAPDHVGAFAAAPIVWNLTRNGDFEDYSTSNNAATAWAISDGLLLGVFAGCGKDGVGMCIQAHQNMGGYSRGFIFQEIYPPSQAATATLSLDYRFFEDGAGASLVYFAAAVMTDTGVITIPLYIDAAHYPGHNVWQTFSAALGAADLARLNAAHAAGQRIYLYVELAATAYNLDVHVDNVAFQVGGAMDYPAIPGVIAYARGNQVRRIEPDGSGDQLLFASAATTNTISDVAWRPDADEIAFVSDHETAYSRWPADVYAISPNGGGLRRMTNPPARSDLPGTYSMGTVTGQIYNNTGDSVLLHIYVQGALEGVGKVAPSGSTVSFSVSDVADLGPGVQQHVTARWGLYGWPEAQTVDVIAGGTVDAGVIQITSETNNYAAHKITWKYDGSRLAFTTMQSALWGVPLAGGTESAVLTETVLMGPAAWSPVDNRILYPRFDSIYLAQEGSGAGTKLFSRSTYPDNVAWLRNGAGFVYVNLSCNKGAASACGWDLYGYDLSSRQHFTLTNLYNEIVAHPRLSPDDQYVVFERVSLTQAQRDVWIMKLLDPTVMWPLTRDGKGTLPDWSRYEPQFHTLTIATAGNGSGVVTPTVGVHTYVSGTVVTLQAKANPGSTFDAWSGDADCADGQVTMNQAKSCIATFTLSGANQPPVARAGADQKVKLEAVVTLDGSGSYDPEGQLITYGWKQAGGPTVILSSAVISRPTFTAPAAPTVLTFTLTVTDSLGLASAPDEAVVTVATSYNIYLPLVIRNG